MDEIKQQNIEKFKEVERFNLPKGKYAITSSGPMGIRGIRLIGDVDIIVTKDLRGELESKYGFIYDEGVKKIKLPNSNIEVLGEGSIYTIEDDEVPVLEQRIKQADIIEGLPFDSLRYILILKPRAGREKDHEDVRKIYEWLSSGRNLYYPADTR